MIARHLIAPALVAAFVHVPAAAEGFRPLIGIEGTVGGKSLATLYSEFGGAKISSGGLIHAFAGIEYQSADSPLAVQFNVGWHYDGRGDGSSSAEFSRLPVELIGFWQAADKWRVGGGLRKATRARVRTSGLADAGSYALESTWGVVLQADYPLGDRAALFGRYVDETYKSSELPGGDVTGRHVGAGFRYRF